MNEQVTSYAWTPPPRIQTASELMERLESPLEVLTNLNFLALQEEAECPNNVRQFLHMTEDQMQVIHKIVQEMQSTEE